MSLLDRIPDGPYSVKTSRGAYFLFAPKTYGHIAVVEVDAQAEQISADLANLFAASPDLFAAANWVAESWGEADQDWCKSDMECAVSALREALAKAEGRE